MQSVKANLLAAFRHLLKPIVSLAIKNGVTFSDFSEVLKQAYVFVASRQLHGADGEITEEGISLVTSLSMDDVKRTLRYLAGEAEFDPVEQTTVFSTLLTAWHTDARYTGPYGVLRDLKFGQVKSRGSADQFESLVALYCPNYSPKVILDELIRTGCVVAVGTDVYRAVKRSYIPDPLSAASILLYARVVHNLCEAAEVNLRAESAGGKGLLQRNVFTNHGISRAHLKDFDKFLRERTQIYADDIDNWLSERDAEGISNSVKTGVSVYHYIVNADDELEISKQLSH